jgi:hypothetical protein
MSSSSRDRLGKSPPIANWTPSFTYSVELTYRINNGVMEFAYKDAPYRTFSGFTELLDFQIQRDFGPFYPLPEFNQQLDLRVKKDCLIGIRLDDEKAMRWSSTQEAITTKGDFSTLYFLLRYVYGGGDYEFGNLPKAMDFKQISFGAECNDAGNYDDPYPFNLDLEVADASGTYKAVTIDPDIKNPSA